jgi:hypothetical protein
LQAYSDEGGCRKQRGRNTFASRDGGMQAVRQLLEA